jgi:O-methyltransferase
VLSARSSSGMPAQSEPLLFFPQMRHPIRTIIDRAFARLGYHRAPHLPGPSFPDISPEDLDKIRSVDAFTMTSFERRYHLLRAVHYIVKHQIPGAFVECGVWRGGSMMLVANTLRCVADLTRDLYLYDTFEGMPPPTELDRDFDNHTAASRMEEDSGIKAESVVWAIAGLQEVIGNMDSTHYPPGKVHFVPGKVEDTIPTTLPDQIALLRLDTDWYESTAHELRHLYPLVSPGGVVIIDDYGYWKGARRAVDEFLAASPDKILLHRIDDTGRAFVKP